MKYRFICAILAAALAVAPMTVRAEEEGGADTVVPVAAPTATPTATPTPLPFEDVRSNDWFESNVRVCFEEKIMMGDSDHTFSPYGTLTEEACAALAARLRARDRGETVPAQAPGESWYAPVIRYLEDLDLGITPGVQCSRGRFLTMLGAVLEDGALEPICEVDALPDTDDPNVLRFYRAGILNGKDAYGTFQASGTLTRAEAAAMVSRILRPELRIAGIFADYSPFRAANVTPSTVFFSNGVTAKRYLEEINALIGELEAACVRDGIEFNWFNTYGEQTFLAYVTETALDNLGVARSMGTQAYSVFNVQVYYSRLLDLRDRQLLGTDPADTPAG